MKKEKERKLGMLERWGIRKVIKKAKKKVQKTKKELEGLRDYVFKEGDKLDGKLEADKVEIIDLITGKGDVIGLNAIFDVIDDDTGKPFTREELESKQIEELLDMLEMILNELEKYL